MSILPATSDDVPALLQLINSAFRGETSKKGWTTEADLLVGDARTDAATLIEILTNPDSVLLKCCDEAGLILGCVHLRRSSRGLYLGMLTVSPEQQGAGIGKRLLQAAEDHAIQIQCPAIYMTVFSVRTELVDWYLRHGYVLTGETQAFEPDPRFGKPVQPLEFVILEKKIIP